jgi:hypothetical protein
MTHLLCMTAVLLLAGGCATTTPVGVNRLGDRLAYEQINSE